MLWLLTVVSGFVLLVLAVMFIITFVRALVAGRELEPLMVLGLLLGLAWLTYVHLAEFVRRVFGRRWPRLPKKPDRPR